MDSSVKRPAGRRRDESSWLLIRSMGPQNKFAAWALRASRLPSSERGRLKLAASTIRRAHRSIQPREGRAHTGKAAEFRSPIETAQRKGWQYWDTRDVPASTNIRPLPENSTISAWILVGLAPLRSA